MIRPTRLIETSVGLAAAANFRQHARQVICVGRNYPDPVVDAKLPRPSKPILFMKSPNGFIDETERIRRPPGCHKLLAEIELGVVFGKTVSNISKQEAMNCVAGYTVALDMTAGDILVTTIIHSIDTYFRRNCEHNNSLGFWPNHLSLLVRLPPSFQKTSFRIRINWSLSVE